MQPAWQSPQPIVTVTRQPTTAGDTSYQAGLADEVRVLGADAGEAGILRQDPRHRLRLRERRAARAAPTWRGADGRRRRGARRRAASGDEEGDEQAASGPRSPGRRRRSIHGLQTVPWRGRFR